MQYVGSNNQHGKPRLIPPNEYEFPRKGSFKDHMDKILLFLDHQPTPVDIFYVLNVISDPLPTLG